MELTNIEKLLEKYLDATTTIEEETILRTYFTSEDVAPHLIEYKALFEYFSESKKETFTKTIQLKTEKRNWKWISVAASFLLIASVFVGYKTNQYRQERKLYAQTQQALAMLSLNLNKGSKAINELQEFELTKDKVFKQPKK